MKKKIKHLAMRHLPQVFFRNIPKRFLRAAYPDTLFIETTNNCNLRCKYCFTPDSKRPRGFMTLGQFKSIIDDLDRRPVKISPYLAGEPLVDKTIFEKIKYATDHGHYTFISTNSMLIDKYVDDFFDSGLDEVIVCMDGMSRESHEWYRVGSDFPTVKKNIELLCKEKKRRKSQKPKIIFQTLVTSKNEHEMEKIEKFARSLGVDEFRKKTFNLGTNPDDKLDGIPKDEKYSRYSLKKGKLQRKGGAKFCSAFRTSVILWNGDVVPCCYDFHASTVIGNVFRDGPFMKIWNSDKHVGMRRKIFNRQLGLCRTCYLLS